MEDAQNSTQQVLSSKLCCRYTEQLVGEAERRCIQNTLKFQKAKEMILAYIFEAKWKIRLGLEKARGEFISASVMLSGLPATGEISLFRSFSIIHFIILHSVFP